MEHYSLKEVEKSTDTSCLIQSIVNNIHCELVNNDNNNNNVVYQDDYKQIVLTKQCNAVNRIIVIKDYKYDNKFLVLFNVYSGYTTMQVYGFFVFFNKGKVAKKMYINNMITSYDHRDVNMSHENMFLYDDHFLFVYDHRDTKRFIGNFVLFNTLNLYDYASMKIYNRYYFSFGGDIIVTNNSHVVIKDKDVYRVIDLYFDDGFSVGEYDDYTKAPVINKDITEFDGYPMKCVRCDKVGSIASAYYGISTIGLGNCFCTECMIRYSKSDRRWYCCQSINHGPCFNVLNDNNYQCDKIHDTNYKLEFNKTYVPPYLEKGSVVYT